MSDSNKVRKIGGAAAPTPVSLSALAKFAESIIRSDKEAALRSQQGVDDLIAPSQDSRDGNGKPVQMSSLEALCGKTGNVKIQRSETESEEETPNNVVTFSSRKKS